MATLNDAKNILDIYTPYINNTSITFEYVVPTLDEFKKRIQKTLLKHPYLVAEKDGEILGYAYASTYKERSAYDWSVESTIYIKQGCNKNGIGKTLYSALENILKKQNIVNVYACITYPNPDSICFHEYMGYKKIAHFTRCGYKLGSSYDIVWMEKFLCDHPINPQPVNLIDFI